MTTTLRSQIIDGGVFLVTQYDSLRATLKTAGVSLIGNGQFARIELAASGTSILLRAVKIITRPSGRKQRHLSRYLIGITEQGVWWEVFLEVVQGLRSALFQLSSSIQAGFLRLAAACLSPDLSVQQRAVIICA